jgi:hypothetical protein
MKQWPKMIINVDARWRSLHRSLHERMHREVAAAHAPVPARGASCTTRLSARRSILRTRDGEHRAMCELRGLMRRGRGRYAASVVMQTQFGSSTNQQVRPFTSVPRDIYATCQATCAK